MSITTILPQTINPDYKKPPDYNEPTIKITDKVMIPQVWIFEPLIIFHNFETHFKSMIILSIFVFQDDHPGLNFMGLLIGPRGNTLKAMEKVLTPFIFCYSADEHTIH